MAKIIIAASSTDVAETTTFALLRGGFIAKKAYISYNLREGIPAESEIEQYPLILEGRLAGYSTKVYVLSVTAGYGGRGPHGLTNILECAGFHFEKNDILTDRLADSSGIIKLTLNR